LDAPIIELDTIDSTNNYAMRLIDADTAQAGLTVWARAQTKGKGQRGRLWKDAPGESLLSSFVCSPECTLEDQFVFNAAVAVAIADVLAHLYEGWDVRIKWPNDIIINDKKAGGILIENVLRGNTWSFSIIGLGLNVAQSSFPADLPFATSLTQASGGKLFPVPQIFHQMRESIYRKTLNISHLEGIMNEYNDFLYRKDCSQSFTSGSQEWRATIRSTRRNGQLDVEMADGSIMHYTHGAQEWRWE
jgi:BirA family biotin operon repressor/biotin-[acetyl-CoA-carboxylase] ligase